MMDINREVYEGWTPQKFIENLEPQFGMITNSQSWRKPFKNKQEAEKWIIENQPYYKRRIPEVINYFCRKYDLT